MKIVTRYLSHSLLQDATIVNLSDSKWITDVFLIMLPVLLFVDKKNQQKRKRLAHHTGSMMAEGSPEHTSLGSPRGAGGATVSRLSVPYSERQQMALLMRMQDESSLGGKNLAKFE